MKALYVIIYNTVYILQNRLVEDDRLTTKTYSVRIINNYCVRLVVFVETETMEHFIFDLETQRDARR